MTQEQNALERLKLHLKSVPRYTSYPPANHFAPGVGQQLQPQYIAAVKESQSVSVYIHIPYCDRLCWFCGCHTKHTLQYDPIATYVDSLVAEIALWRGKLGRRPHLAKLHLGGGSPSLLKPAELGKIKTALESLLVWDQRSEVSIEIDPTDVKENTIADLLAFGLTRASIGVQDFDPAVQAAINRPQGFDETRAVVEALRRAGIRSINIDALYGLPLQTMERLTRTIEQVIALQPDRIALFGYAHVPWLKPHQKMIRDEDLPDGDARMAQAREAARLVVSAGYQAIGIDHFAKPGDSLAVAAREGRLHRNFQGYTEDDSPVLLGLGPSSVSRFPGGFIQNEVATGAYIRNMTAGALPLGKGFALSEEDRARSWLIERLLCDFAFSLAELRKNFGELGAKLEREARHIAAAEQDGLCQVNNGMFLVPPDAWPLVRIVASRFDSYMTAGNQRYSKAV